MSPETGLRSTEMRREARHAVRADVRVILASEAPYGLVVLFKVIRGNKPVLDPPVVLRLPGVQSLWREVAHCAAPICCRVRYPLSSTFQGGICPGLPTPK
jgi:hypothetical protein